jgi:hypothetical protein
MEDRMRSVRFFRLFWLIDYKMMLWFADKSGPRSVPCNYLFAANISSPVTESFLRHLPPEEQAGYRKKLPDLTIKTKDHGSSSKKHDWTLFVIEVHDWGVLFDRILFNETNPNFGLFPIASSLGRIAEHVIYIRNHAGNWIRGICIKT